MYNLLGVALKYSYTQWQDQHQLEQETIFIAYFLEQSTLSTAKCQEFFRVFLIKLFYWIYFSHI